VKEEKFCYDDDDGESFKVKPHKVVAVNVRKRREMRRCLSFFWFRKKKKLSFRDEMEGKKKLNI
jgi:hypothetical protein